MILIDGKKIAAELREELKKEVEKYLENIRDHFGDKIEAAEYTIMTRDNEITK